MPLIRAPGCGREPSIEPEVQMLPMVDKGLY
jgi:hypothetical protein